MACREFVSRYPDAYVAFSRFKSSLNLISSASGSFEAASPVKPATSDEFKTTISVNEKIIS